MPQQTSIWIALIISMVAFLACLWQFANIKGYKARGRRRAPASAQQHSNRSSDRRTLIGYEKRLFNTARKLITQGKILPAARILEQLNMPREAIQALEDAGLIHDAAKILMRMQRHNRAGVIYARHGMWSNAAQCFKVANMPLEVAKSAREGGDFAMAAEYFEKIGRLDAAAECCEQQGDIRRAAKLFLNAGVQARAMQLYDQLGQAAKDLAAIELQDEELKEIVKFLSDGHTPAGLVTIAVNYHKLKNVILSLVSKGHNKQAAEILPLATADLGPQLMSEVSYQDASAENLADVFLKVSQPQFAGMIYERMNAFASAAQAFEQAENFERAAYCYERAGQPAKAKAVKNKPSSAKPEKSAHVPANPAPVLDTPHQTEEPSASFAFGPSTDQSTAVIIQNDNPPIPAPPVPPPPMQGNFSLSLVSEHDRTGIMMTNANHRMTYDAPADHGVHDNHQSADYKARARAFDVDETRSAFHRAKFLEDLDFEQKNKIWDISQPQEFKTGESILNYDDEPKGVYVIVAGAVNCFRINSGKESYIDQMSETETFGELWLLADQPTAVHFVAAQETQIRVVERSDFNTLMDKDGTIARKLYKRFTMRLLKRLLRPQNNTKNKAAS